MHLISTIKHYLWRVIMKRMHLDFKLRSGIDVIIRSYADWCTYNDLFVNDEYTDAIIGAIAEWGPTAGQERLCVLDLGANMGFFTLQLADIFLQKCAAGTLAIRLVEASPDVAGELQRRLIIPGGRVDAKVINGLVGKREGAAELNFGKEDTINFVGEKADLWGQARGARTVQYVDRNSATADMPVIHLIKCDIEGSEFPFLDSYPELLRKTRRMVIEFHSPFGDIARATEALRAVGFTKVSILRESGLTPTIYFSRE